MAHTGRPVDIPGVCIAPAFRQVVRLGASWSVLFTCLCLYTPQLLAASAFQCPSLLSLRAHMDELQNMRLPLDTTWWNHSYYTGNPLSALHSLQQLQAGASSSSLCRYRLPHGSHMVQYFELCVLPTGYTQCHQSTGQTGPTRTVTRDLMSATLAEAATQLSFCCILGALHLCVCFAAAPATHPHPIPGCRHAFDTSLSLRTFLRNSRSRSSWLHLLCTMFSAPRVPDPSLRYFLKRLCRRLCTASHLTMPPHNYRSRSSSPGVSSPMTLQTGKPRHRHIAMLAAPHLHIFADIATLCSPSSASHASDGHEHTTAPRVLPQPPPGLEKSWHTC